MTTARESNLAQSLRDMVAASVLWKYSDPEGNEFYLMKKQTGSIRSPYTGKSFTGKPERFSLSDVGKELKQDAKDEKTAAVEDFWKASGSAEPVMYAPAESLPEIKLGAKTLPGSLWEYSDEEGNKFYLPKKQTGTLKSPFSGKTFTAKPIKNTLSDVGKDLKQEGKTASTPVLAQEEEPKEEAKEPEAQAEQQKEASVEELWKVDPTFAVLGANKEACGCSTTADEQSEKPWEKGEEKQAAQKTAAQVLAGELLGAGADHAALQVVAKEWQSILDGVKVAQDKSKTASGPEAIVSNLVPRLRNLAKTASIVAAQLETRLK